MTQAICFILFTVFMFWWFIRASNRVRSQQNAYDTKGKVLIGFTIVSAIVLVIVLVITLP